MTFARPVEWDLLLRQAFRPFVRRLATGWWRGSVVHLSDDVCAIARHRLWPIEQRQLAAHLPVIVAQRDELFLQADLARSLRPFQAILARHPIGSKLRFAQFCQVAGLPHPPVIPVSRALADPALLEPLGPNLFVKPDWGSSSIGVAALHRCDAGLWQLSDASGSQAIALDAALLRLSQGRECLFQPLLENPAALGAPAGLPVITLRIITGACPLTEPQVLATLVQIARDDTRPLSARWLALPLDPATLRCAEVEGAAMTGATGTFDPFALALAGTSLPSSDAALALATRAHACVLAQAECPLPPMIGWDLALTDAGPVLLEGNWNWGVAAHYANAAGFDTGLSDIFAQFSSAKQR